MVAAVTTATLTKSAGLHVPGPGGVGLVTQVCFQRVTMETAPAEPSLGFPSSVYQTLRGAAAALVSSGFVSYWPLGPGHPRWRRHTA